MRKLISASFLLLLYVPSFGQTSGIYPDQFSSYFYNKSFINPAFIPKDGISEASVQSKLRSGIYSDIYSIAATIQKTFGKEDLQKHSGRVLFFNEKEGPYISTPRFYGNYATQIRISDKFNLLGGASLGVVNPNYRTPTKTVSTVLIDGSIGIILRSQNMSIGFSSGHIFNNSPEVNREIKLKRFFNTYFENSLTLSYEIDLKTYLRWIYFSDIPSQINAAVSVLYNKTLEAGVGYNYKRGAFFYTSVMIDPSSKHPLRLGALYNSVFLDNLPALGGSLELSLSYFY